jgi:uncharacterized coiled-coil protein SlyX
MKISKLKTMTDPNLVDVILALDIDGGANQSPTLRLVTLASILELIVNTGDPISQSVIDEINAQLTTLGNRYSNVNTSLQSLTTVINSLVAQNADSRLTQLSTSLSTLANAYNAYISANNTVVNSTSAALDLLTTKVDSNITSDDTRLDAIEFSQGGLQSNFNGLVNRVNTLSQTVTGQGETVDYINNENVTKGVQISDLQTQIAALRLLLPSGFQHWHDTSKIVTGGALASVQVAASFYSTMWQQNSAALNDSFSFTTLLSAGTYTLVILMTRATNKGKLQLKINNVLAFNDVDGYNPTTIFERVMRTITITTGGLQEFVFTVYSKNASSTAYFNLINKISAYKN